MNFHKLFLKLLTLGLSGFLALSEPSALLAEEKDPNSYAPEVESKIIEIQGKLKELKRGPWKHRMEEEVATVSQITQLNAEGIQKLQGAAEIALEASLEASATARTKLFRKTLHDSLSIPPDARHDIPGTLIILDQFLDQLKYNTSFVASEIFPFEHPAWTEALGRILTPEQSSAWEKGAKERLEKLRADNDKPFKLMHSRRADERSLPLNNDVARVSALLDLPPERQEPLKQLAKKWALKFADQWIAATERTLLGGESTKRILSKDIPAHLNYHTDLGEEQTLAFKNGWESELTHLLSPDEQDRLKQVKAESKARRREALSQILIALMDEKVALTEIQREKLLPLAEKLVSPWQSEIELQYFSHANYSPINYFVLCRLAAGLSESEALNILDPLQWQHWKEACSVLLLKRQVNSANQPANQASGSWEPEESEEAISDYFQEKIAVRRKTFQAAHLLKIEDFNRATLLSPRTIEQLQTAARGMAELELKKWMDTQQQSARGFAANYPPEKIRNALVNFELNEHRATPELTPAELRLLNQVIETETTETQRATWKKQTAQRETFLTAAVANLILSEVDRLTFLSPELWKKSSTMVLANIRENQDEIRTMFPYGGWGRWYFQSHAMFLPVAGIPEKKLKELWGEKRWELWTSVPYVTNATTYWENMQNNRTRKKETK